MTPNEFDIHRFDLDSVSEVQCFAGVSRQTIDTWMRRGLPRTRRGEGAVQRYTYNAVEIFQWYVKTGPGARHSKALSRPQQEIPFNEEEVLLTGPETPATERWRLSRAKLSELQYERECKSVVPKEEILIEIAGLAGHLRKLGEQLAQRFGPDAQRLLNAALAEYRDMVSKKYGHPAGSTADSGDGHGPDDNGGDGAGSPSDQPMGGRGDLDSIGGTQGQAVLAQPAPSQPDLVQ